MNSVKSGRFIFSILSALFLLAFLSIGFFTPNAERQDSIRAGSTHVGFCDLVSLCKDGETLYAETADRRLLCLEGGEVVAQYFFPYSSTYYTVQDGLLFFAKGAKADVYGLDGRWIREQRQMPETAAQTSPVLQDKTTQYIIDSGTFFTRIVQITPQSGHETMYSFGNTTLHDLLKIVTGIFWIGFAVAALFSAKKAKDKQSRSGSQK